MKTSKFSWERTGGVGVGGEDDQEEEEGVVLCLADDDCCLEAGSSLPLQVGPAEAGAGEGRVRGGLNQNTLWLGERGIVRGAARAHACASRAAGQLRRAAAIGGEVFHGSQIVPWSKMGPWGYGS